MVLLEIQDLPQSFQNFLSGVNIVFENKFKIRATDFIFMQMYFIIYLHYCFLKFHVHNISVSLFKRTWKFTLHVRIKYLLQQNWKQTVMNQCLCCIFVVYQPGNRTDSMLFFIDVRWRIWKVLWVFLTLNPSISK